MEPLSPSALSQRYANLKAQLDSDAISYQQFIESVHQLRAQDAAGTWWTIDPRTGRYLAYSGEEWVEAELPPFEPQPPAASERAAAPRSERAAAKSPSNARRAIGRGRGCLTASTGTTALSLGAAGMWFLWTAAGGIDGGQELDLFTPLLMAGLPLLLRRFRRRIDRRLKPLYARLRRFPRSLRVVAAFSLPVVTAVVSGGGGVGALRFATFTSVVFGYILTRRPEGGV
jgi:hypothetical protein